MSPFTHDTSAALAAHARQPAGREYRHLTDDPETPEEIRAEADRRRSNEYTRRMRDKWRRYESLKAQFIAEHPDATPAEYEAAMHRLAEEAGV